MILALFKRAFEKLGLTFSDVDDKMVFNPVRLAHMGFDGGEFELTFSGLYTNTRYQLARTTNLLNEITVLPGTEKVSPGETDVFIDKNSPSQAFYQLWEAL